MITEQATNIAVFCDYENIAIGVREADYDGFEITLVLERLLDKGNVVVKKAYADWERYKNDRRSLHEHAFELIEIPHVSYSGKNSADIRMVVDALDLCYTKTHINTFVILSGDSDFSPLVSKLRENNKTVIAIGVRKSSSQLLMENCDEFIYYDDLMVKKKVRNRRPRRKPADPAKPKSPKSAEKVVVEAEEVDDPMELVMEVIESLFESGDTNIWGNTVRKAVKRRKPNFSERAYGFGYFNQILEKAEEKGYLLLNKDERTGSCRILGIGPKWIEE